MLQMWPIANVSDPASFTYSDCTAPCNLKTIPQESRHLQHSHLSVLSLIIRQRVNPLIRFVLFGFYVIFDYLWWSNTKDAALTSTLPSFSSALPRGGAVGSLVTRQKTPGKFTFEHNLSKHLLQTWPLLVQVFQTTAYNNSYDQDKSCTRLLSSEIIQYDFI